MIPLDAIGVSMNFVGAVLILQEHRMKRKSLDIAVGVIVSIMSSSLFAAIEDYAKPDINIVVDETCSLEIEDSEVQVQYVA